jgi:nucleotide-binding universal stress UspA family protein
MKKIIAAIDFSDSTEPVITAATAQAKAFDAELHLVHVIEPEPSYTAYGFTPDEFPAMHTFQQEARKRAQLRLEEVAAKHPGTKSHLGEGSPLQTLLDYIDESKADLVIIGTHGHGMVASLLLGSVAEGMVRKAVIPTLVIPVKK